MTVKSSMAERELLESEGRSPRGLASISKALRRAAVVWVLQWAVSEATLQLSVNWRESSEELATAALYVFTLVGAVWVAMPILAIPRGRAVTTLLCCATAAAFFAITYTAEYLYFWHLRPNLGLYREPGWVQQHPGFQRQLRQRMQANLWWRQSGVGQQELDGPKATEGR
jgi:hypothetical protein